MKRVEERKQGKQNAQKISSVSTKPSNEAYRPLQTGVIRSLDRRATTLVMRLLGPPREGTTNRSARHITSKTPFFFIMMLIFFCRALVPVTLSRPGCQLHLLQFRSSGPCAWLLATQTVNGQIPTSQKSRIHRDSKR